MGGRGWGDDKLSDLFTAVAGTIFDLATEPHMVARLTWTHKGFKSCFSRVQHVHRPKQSCSVSPKHTLMVELSGRTDNNNQA